MPEVDVQSHGNCREGVRRQHGPPGKYAARAGKEDIGESVEEDFEHDEDDQEGEPEGGFPYREMYQLGDQNSKTDKGGEVHEAVQGDGFGHGSAGRRLPAEQHHLAQYARRKEWPAGYDVQYQEPAGNGKGANDAD